MNALLNLAALVTEEREMLRRNWGWFVTLGVVLTVLGIAGLVFVGAATLFTVVLVGWFLLIGGILEIAFAIARKGWQGFLLDLLSGVLIAVAGLFILLRPVEGASVITMLLGILFLIGGIFRVAAGIAMKNPYRGWFILHGAVSLVLGLIILANWPVSAAWAIGTLVSIELLVDGLRLISFGLAVKKLPPIGGDEERTPKPATAAPPMA
jgi:uncharacterized membrane protein HdeD (DUF308 family)